MSYELTGSDEISDYKCTVTYGMLEGKSKIDELSDGDELSGRRINRFLLYL